MACSNNDTTRAEDFGETGFGLEYALCVFRRYRTRYQHHDAAKQQKLQRLGNVGRSNAGGTASSGDTPLANVVFSWWPKETVKNEPAGSNTGTGDFVLFHPSEFFTHTFLRSER